MKRFLFGVLIILCAACKPDNSSEPNTPTAQAPEIEVRKLNN